MAMTAPNSELRVSKRLLDFNYSHILFTRRAQIVRRGRKLERLVAAWPRYVFIWVVDAWDLLLKISGLWIVAHKLPEPTIAHIQTLTAKYPDHVLPTPIRPCRFAVGDKVLIQGQSLLAGRTAIFREAIDENFVLVEQEWLGRVVSFPVDERDVEKFVLSKPKKKRRRRSRRPRSYERSAPPAIVSSPT